jgi:NAD+ diphosphatase
MTAASPCDQLSDAERFVARLAPPPGEREGALWFVFQDDKMLYRAGTIYAEALRTNDVDLFGDATIRSLYLGYLDRPDGTQGDCYAAELPPGASLPEGITADGLRGVYPLLSETLFGVASRAVQLLAWDRTNQYCGQCGVRTENAPKERAKQCPACRLTIYPRLSPAIIIAVVRHTASGPQLLLARNHRFPPGRYSVIAGYVEPGETLEECAEREVCEEVGIAIKDVKYFGSQPWPFPNSLMLAFTADYAGGDIRIEESEIADAGWFGADSLPGLPPKMSVARRLIDWFVATYS